MYKIKSEHRVDLHQPPKFITNPSEGIPNLSEDLKITIDLFKIVNEHYRNDINAVWSRGQFFVVVYGALIGYITSADLSADSIKTIAKVGIFLGLIWFVLSSITSKWIGVWREIVISVESRLFVKGPYVTGENGRGLHRILRPHHMSWIVALISVFFWGYVFLCGVTWKTFPAALDNGPPKLLNCEWEDVEKTGSNLYS